MSKFLRAALVATVIATAATLAAPTSPASAALPTAAVALGDSFISGEGAGNYQPVVDSGGVAQSFPGWSAPNSNAFFCHRSANASLLQATLPGIADRYNLACSGGRPADLATASSARDKGRSVAAQLDQLRAVAQTHDIDLVLVGLGSNNSQFTFGDVAEKCANRFIADAWTGWWEFWAYLGGPVEQAPCAAADLATAAQFSAATTETVNAVRQLLITLNQVDADHQHRVVFQDYTNPLPLDLDPSYWEADGRQDDRDKFRDLGALRYAAGCPIHRASLSAGHLFSQGLGTLVQNVRNTLAAEFPNDDLVFLDVQHAFDGARLCEHPGSPAGALATPIRLQDGPSGTFVTSLSGKDKIAIQRIANTCASYFQTCQESWHPTAAGQAVLARCLNAATTTAARAVTCTRQPDGTIVTT
ncbi:SGNH/GDSL hydrolase family protein [Dactylosporangium sp. CA-233914]|uniref:SGNH/GDSL hydrolase family protein n=1 Tax=Dactylosporangium sp. CA-233914 TaxID=3239934 RepID=UPI003D94F4A3